MTKGSGRVRQAGPFAGVKQLRLHRRLGGGRQCHECGRSTTALRSLGCAGTTGMIVTVVIRV